MKFNKGDIVDGIAPVNRTNGIIKYVACIDATTSKNKVCDKKTCSHQPREYVWVLWTGIKMLMSYHESELQLVTAASIPIEPDKIISIDDSISLDKKTSIKLAFDEMEKKLPAEPASWDKYNGFDKRYASKKDYDEKKVIQESEMDKEFWHRYNYVGNATADRRTLR